MAKTAGFIGLGTMGSGLAASLVRGGFTVLGYDTDAERLAAAQQNGVRSAASAAEAARQAEVVFTCLPADEAVRLVYFGEGGVAAALGQGQFSCDLSTVAPETAEEVARGVEARGARHLEAPMLGSEPQAERGEVFLILGCEEADLQQLQPWFKALARQWIRVGPCGLGAKVKLLHNAVGAFNYAAVAEALGMCVASGVNLQTFYEVVCMGGGMAYGNYFQRKVPAIIRQDYTPRFQLRLAAKDARLAQALFEAAGVEAPLLAEGRDRLEKAMEAGWGAEDCSVVTRLVEQHLDKPILQG